MRSKRKSNTVVPTAKNRDLPRITQNQIRHFILLRQHADAGKNRIFLRKLEAELRSLIEAGAKTEPGDFRLHLEPTIVVTENR